MREIVLQTRQLTKRYKDSAALDHADITVYRKDIYGLIGRNGVGKSTTLKSIMGIVRTRSGEIIFDGEDISKKPAYERVKLGIGYVPQGRDIFPQMTVQENLDLGLQPVGGKGTIPDYIFELFPILPKFAKRKGRI